MSSSPPVPSLASASAALSPRGRTGDAASRREGALRVPISTQLEPREPHADARVARHPHVAGPLRARERRLLESQESPQIAEDDDAPRARVGHAGEHRRVRHGGAGVDLRVTPQPSWPFAFVYGGKRGSAIKLRAAPADAPEASRIVEQEEPLVRAKRAALGGSNRRL